MSADGVKSFWRIACNKPDPPVIVLAGTGDADEYDQMRRHWPDARIVGIEPLPRLRRRASRVFLDAHKPILPVALDRANGTAKLGYGYKPDQRASIIPRKYDFSAGGHVDVETWSLERLCSYIEVDSPGFSGGLLWLDVEGAETRILGDASHAFEEHFDWLNVEVTFRQIRRAADYWELDFLLRSRGWLAMGVHSPAKNGGQCDFVYTKPNIRAELMDYIARDATERQERIERERREKHERIRLGKQSG